MGDESLSIEETNKLREKLGLKPLKSDSEPKKEKTAEDNYKEYKDTLKSETEAKEIKNRIDKAKEKRLLASKLKGKTLADVSDDEDDAASWVLKQKQMAEKRAKEAEESEKRIEKESKQQEYKSENLKGLKIAHDVNDIQTGEVKILTLKDSTILENEEEGDELESIQIVEQNKLKENLDRKKKKTVYTGVDDDEFTPDGMPKKKSLLPQYDDVLNGSEKKMVFIGDSGEVEASNDQDGEENRGQAISLDVNKMQEIREFYTEQELVKFKKVKPKKKKVKSKSTNLLDEIDFADAAAPTDHGSRANRGKKKQKENREDENGDEEMEIVAPSELTKDENEENENDTSYVPTQENFVDDDDLQEALKRARRIQLKKKDTSSVVAVAEAARQARLKEASETEEASKTGKELVISATTEFIRDIDETYLDARTIQIVNPITKNDKRESSAEPGADEVMEDYLNNNGDAHSDSDNAPELRRSASPASISSRARSPTVTSERPKELQGIVEEPLVANGMAATLSLLQSKGYLDKRSEEEIEDERRRLERQKWLKEQKVKELTRELKYEKEKKEKESRDPKTKKDRDRDRERDKHERERERERESVKKFENYQPEIKLEYTDKFGRQLNPKEAFRELSHRFHGKPPGKKKTEKELRKIEAELNKQKNAQETSLFGSVISLENRQKALGQAGIVIQKGNRSVLPALNPNDSGKNNQKRKGEASEGNQSKKEKK